MIIYEIVTVRRIHLLRVTSKLETKIHTHTHSHEYTYTVCRSRGPAWTEVRIKVGRREAILVP
jgi:hypothetical protein